MGTQFINKKIKTLKRCIKDLKYLSCNTDREQEMLKELEREKYSSCKNCGYTENIR